MSQLPYWRLSGFYFFYFASLGAMMPYLGLYLRDQGFSAAEIGELLALLSLTRILAPNLWGWLADYSGQPMWVVRLATLLSVLFFAGIFLAQFYWWVALVLVGSSFFWNASLPQLEAITLAHLADKAEQYSHIRLWGSVGFILSVVGLGYLLEYEAVIRVPQVILGLFVAILLISWLIPDAPRHLHLENKQALRHIVMQPQVLAVLAISFLVQFSHAPYYTFYTLYLGDFGYDQGVIGLLWALGVIAEIGLFLTVRPLFYHFRLAHLLLLATVLTAVRWLLIAFFPEYLAVLIFAQLLHAASFGLYHMCLIQLIHRYFSGQHQGQGQALYSSISFGAGMSLGTLLSGYLWHFSPALTLVCASVACVLAVWVNWRWLRV